MAENDPNNWAKSPGFNTWGHVGIAKDNDFYKLLDETKEKTDAVFEVVNLVFDLVNSALDFIASLLIDFTNPLKPIIEAIIALLESFISDLRNFGWYLTYDKEEFKNPTEDLLGGYPAFESRMIEKLLNLKDPTRPNFSPESKVFAMTFFAGADASKLGAIISMLKKLLKLFLSFGGKSDEAEAPIKLNVGYYNNVVGDIELPNTYKPDGIRVRWNLPSPPSTNKVLPKTFILPDYFLFSVATRNANEKIAYINQKRREATDKEGIENKGDTKSTVQPLTGGITDPRLWPLIKVDKEAPINFTKLDESEVFEALDKTPKGTGKLGSFIIKGEDDSVYLNKIGDQPISDAYRCFIYGGGGGGLVGDNDFSFDIPLENLKIKKKLDPEYYITMYSMTIESKDYEDTSKKTTPLPVLRGLNIRLGTHEAIETAEFITVSTKDSSYSLKMDKGSLSKPSATVVVKSPSELRDKYLKAVKFYFLSTLLAQPHLSPQNKLLDYEASSKELKLMGLYGYDSIYKPLYYSKQGKQEFSKGIQKWLREIMLKFKSETPSDAILNSMRDSLDKINSFPIDLVELVKDASEWKKISQGLFADLTSLERSSDYIFDIVQADFKSNYDLEVARNAGIDTELSSYIYTTFTHTKWPGNKQPALIALESGFIGHIFYAKDFKETFRLSRKIVALNPPSVSETGQWLNQRPFRDSDLSALTNVLDIVKKYMEGFLKGLEGIVAQILKFIHMLKTRIAQVQAIIARIKALIDLILSFRFPAGLYGTFHLADGTSGLVSALQQSEDKPDIGTSGYGTGLMVVAGGAPTILIDFLIALMGGEGEE